MWNMRKGHPSVMTDEAPAPAPAPGLRERKKRRTRDALLRAALLLFVAQGYEHTTVDEITDAVYVSQRTFFRYFANKEEVAFAVQDLVEAHFVAALRSRPPAEGRSKPCGARCSTPGTPSTRPSPTWSRSISTCAPTS